MNEGTSKLPDDNPAEGGGELMAEKPEKFEFESMFPAEVKRDTEEHVFFEWLCIVAKMWCNDSPNALEKSLSEILGGEHKRRRGGSRGWDNQGFC